VQGGALAAPWEFAINNLLNQTYITKLVTFHAGDVLHLAKNPARTLDFHYYTYCLVLISMGSSVKILATIYRL
jgi:hypothetical protein